ncbi:hypothetical protein ACR6C2_24730 [Streptomyces sp. INA 01156]
MPSASRYTADRYSRRVPNSVFYDDPQGRSQVRFAFCKRDDVLHEATGRLARLG